MTESFNPLKTDHNRQWLKFRIKSYAVVAGLILTAVFGFYTTLNWQFLKITDIQVTGLDTEKKDDFLRKLEPIIFKNKISGILGLENYFSWPKEISGLALMSLQQPNLDFASITINKDLFKHQITVDMHKRQRLGIICENNSADSAISPRLSVTNCWWFDDTDGLLMSEAPFADGQMFFRINETGMVNLALGQLILPESLFINLKIILEILKDLNIAIADMRLDRALEELTIASTGHFRLIFSLRFDPSAVIGSVKDLLVKTPAEKIDYIDLTVENKIYLKAR